ncbi:AMIN-like domain-containing (lipo)protein [Paraoerskovia marina]|uniref:AMIN-like domain-containing (lipo)protein n=1 Tax=Paraoerskovia marina TaxID=545619 RepID=UPI000492E009|nr:hypothetical protein [Paraoerskovia marina]
MHHRRTARLAAAVALTGAVLAASGCSDDQAAPEPTATGTATSSVAEDTEPAPTTQDADETEQDAPTDDATTEDDDSDVPFPATTAVDTSDASGDAALTVTDIRVGVHDGYDRVVLDLGGTGTPGWRAEYVDSAVQDGSGVELDVEGEAILQVTVTGSAYPMDSGQEEYPGPDRVAAAGTAVLEEVRYDHIFEGQTQVFVGVDAEVPFRVFSLEDPTRVVIDLRDG